MQCHKDREVIMKTISAALSLAALVILPMDAYAQSNAQTPSRGEQPAPLDARVIRAEKRSLDAIAEEVIAPGITRQVVHGTQTTFSRWQLKAGSAVPLHHHVNEQMTWIMSGRAEVLSGGTMHELRAGDIMVFAPNVEHAFKILEDTVAIDIFSPARQDWIDDAARAKQQP